MVLKDNYTSKESDKMIVNIQCLWISIKNIVKIKELNFKINLKIQESTNYIFF